MSRILKTVMGLVCLVSISRADLIGTQVTGSAILPSSTANQFDPNTLAEPSYCGNTSSTTVTIQPPSDPSAGPYTFCAVFKPAVVALGGAAANAIVAQFTGSLLTIQVQFGSQPSWTTFQLTFADAGFAGLQLQKYTDNFLYAPDGTQGLSASLSGTTITITGGVPAAGGVFNASYQIISPNTSSISQPTGALAQSFAYPNFAWNAVAGAQAYTLWLGTDTAGENTFNSWQIPPSQSSLTLPIVLLNPETATLWTEINGAWTSSTGGVSLATTNLLGSQSGNPGYLGSVGWESLIYPLNGATNVDPFKPFVWNGGIHDGTTLIVGSTPGASDVFNSGTLQGTNLPHPLRSGSSLPVTGLQPNATYFARLTGPANLSSPPPAGLNTPTDVKFTTGVGKAHLIVPADQAQQVPSGNVTFTINPVQGALQYDLWLGTSPGGNDIGEGWPGAATSATVVLAPGQVYYARIWTQLASGDWTWVDSRFSTYTTDVAFFAFPANGEQHALADALILAHVPPNEIVTGWNQVSGATGYAIWIGTSPLASDVLNSTNGAFFAGNMAEEVVVLSDNTTYYVTLWTNKGSQWYATQSTFSTFPQTPVSQIGSDPQ